MKLATWSDPNSKILENRSTRCELLSNRVQYGAGKEQYTRERTSERATLRAVCERFVAPEPSCVLRWGAGWRRRLQLQLGSESLPPLRTRKPARGGPCAELARPFADSSTRPAGRPACTQISSARPANTTPPLAPPCRPPASASRAARISRACAARTHSKLWPPDSATEPQGAPMLTPAVNLVQLCICCFDYCFTLVIIVLTFICIYIKEELRNQREPKWRPQRC